MNEQGSHNEPRERDKWDYIIAVVLLVLACVCVYIAGGDIITRLTA